MHRERVAELLRDVLFTLSQSNKSFPVPPEKLDENMLLEDLGIRLATSEPLIEELKTRFGAIPDISLLLFLKERFPETQWEGNDYSKVKHIISQLKAGVQHQIRNPMVVYVDDEEENLFIFKRKFGGRMQLKTFQDPSVAIQFILKTPEVVLVLTDEVMPGIKGNDLRDIVHQQKPYLKFVLITGNPQHDDNLLYTSLKGNRFFDFFQKPLDLENKSEEYFSVFNEILSGDYY